MITKEAREFKLVPLNEVPTGDSLTVLWYGGSGSGKTWSCGTAGDRCIIVDCGSGHETLKSPRFKQLVSTNPLVIDIADYIKPSGLQSLEEGFDLIADILEYCFSKRLDDFDTIAIDDMTAVRRYAMAKGVLMQADIGDKGRSGTKAFYEKHGVIIPLVQDYQAEMAVIEQFVDHFNSMAKSHKKHMIMTAHERLTFTKPDKIGGQPTLVNIRPGFTGQTFPDDVTGLFDEVWRFELIGAGTNTIYRADFVGGEVVTAKSRHAGIFDGLVDRSNRSVINNPNFLKLIEAIKKGS